MKTSKVKDFLAAIAEGKTKEEAIAISGCSESTAKIQLSKWKSSKKEPKEEKPKSPIPGIALPK